MSDWLGLLREPEGLGETKPWTEWFDAIAARLLNGSRLHVLGQPHRFTEVEFYYHGGAHPDPFTHRDPVQLECGRWYFHRTRGVYRGGSFNGFDLTFGGPDVYGGVLIRGLEKPDGTLVDGPSLCVDHLLAVTGASDVAELDRAIGTRVAWDQTNLLRLMWIDPMDDRPVHRSARVGLSLKRARKSPEPPRYVLRPYRYFTEPRRIGKGKAQMVLALHVAGKSAEEIHALTGCPRATVQRYVSDFEEGRSERDFGPYYGIDLSPKDLCRLHGTWHANFGGK